MRDTSDDLRFERFIDRILLTQDELLLARKAAQNVAAVLRDKLQPGVDERVDHLVVGSIGKRTAIRPLSMVDLVYLLPDPSLIQDGLFRIERILRQGMPGIIPVPIDFGLLVPLEDLTVRVLLAKERPRGFAFWTTRGYVDSHPAAEITALRLSDSLSGGRTTRLLTLLKAWATADQVPLPSFALEILARDFMSDHGGSHWPDILSDFFAWVRHKDTSAVDRPGSNQPLHVDAGWQKQAEAAYWRCVLAKRLAGEGDPLAELAEWQRLLGPAFGHHDE
jgi:hypothetical protein